MAKGSIDLNDDTLKTPLFAGAGPYVNKSMQIM